MPLTSELTEGCHVYLHCRRTSDYMSACTNVDTNRGKQTIGGAALEILSLEPGLRKCKGYQVIEQVMADGCKAANHSDRLEWGCETYATSWQRDSGFPVVLPSVVTGGQPITVWVHIVLLWTCADGPMMVRRRAGAAAGVF